MLEHCNRSYGDILDTYGAVPKNLVHASLLLCTIGYEQRSGVSAQNMSIVPYGNIDLLMKPYMKLAGSVTGDEYQTVTLGSDVKIEFTADLPDGLKLSDVDFSGRVSNTDIPANVLQFAKADCIEVADGESYVVLVDTEQMGIGLLMLKLVVLIPDTDYTTGLRKEVININPHIQIRG